MASAHDSQITAQAIYKAQAAYAEEHKQWMKAALAAINVWGRREKTLPHAIAVALEEMWQKGRQGIPPLEVLPEQTSRRIVRTAKKPPPPTVRRITRCR